MNTPIVETQATGKQVEVLVDKILRVLDGEDRAHGILACLTLALILEKENITPEQIQEGVLGTSQYICAFLGETEGTAIN